VESEELEATTRPWMEGYTNTLFGYDLTTQFLSKFKW